MDSVSIDSYNKYDNICCMSSFLEILQKVNQYNSSISLHYTLFYLENMISNEPGDLILLTLILLLCFDDIALDLPEGSVAMLNFVRSIRNL